MKLCNAALMHLFKKHSHEKKVAIQRLCLLQSS